LGSNLTEAELRMARVALGLSQLLGPMRAASLLAGAALTLLRRTHGDETARAFFAGVADEINMEQPGSLN
jgi:hypothetical protein